MATDTIAQSVSNVGPHDHGGVGATGVRGVDDRATRATASAGATGRVVATAVVATSGRCSELTCEPRGSSIEATTPLSRPGRMSRAQPGSMPDTNTEEPPVVQASLTTSSST